MNPYWLWPDSNVYSFLCGRPVGNREQRHNSAKQCDTDERHSLGMKASDLSFQHFPRIDVFGWTEIINARAGTGNEIGDAKPPFREAIVILIGQRSRHEARIGQEFPEPVRIAGEMMSGYRRSHARIDPDKQHSQVSTNAVTQTQLRPNGPDTLLSRNFHDWVLIIIRMY